MKNLSDSPQQPSPQAPPLDVPGNGSPAGEPPNGVQSTPPVQEPPRESPLAPPPADQPFDTPPARMSNARMSNQAEGEDVEPLHSDEAAARRQAALTWLVAGVGIVVFALLRPSTAYTIGVFLALLGVLVFVHEWGHYQFARWAGMKVNRFGIGFPPWIYTRRYKGIDYSIGALPIGGMVDIAGLGSEEEMVAAAKGAEFSTREAVRGIPFGERQFQDSRLGWRFMTLFAGPMMNFVFALWVYLCLYSLVGIPSKITGTNIIDMVLPGMPADKAGLRFQDKVLGVNDLRTTDPGKLAKAIESSGGKPVTLVIEREGQTITRQLQPVVDTKEVLENGKIVKKQLPKIGIVFYTRIDAYEKQSLGVAMQLGWWQATGFARQILGLVGRAATFKLTSDDKKDVGGPVRIAQVAGQAAQHGWQDLALLAAALSVNLGLINLLPFPALDGGRILFLGYEFIMRRPLDPKKESLVHLVGMVMLLAFMLFITVRDVLPLIRH